MPWAGLGMSSSVSRALNWPRSSAKAIEAGEVPRMGTPWASNGAARLSGVCPPNWTTTPLSGVSRAAIARTCSSVSGSKYSRSEVS